MKNLIILSVTAFLSAACGASELNELETLIAQKDSLKIVKDELSISIVEIETKITDLDTTKSFTLVTTETAKIDNFKHYFQVYGTVESDKNVQIYSEVSGKILEVKVKEGDKVSKGQVVVVIDVSIMRDKELELKTRLELAETTYQKQKKLWDQNIGSEMQYLRAKSNRDALKSSLNTLQTQIAMGSVKAPFAGVIDETFSNAGEMAMPGFPLIRLINLDLVYIKADVSENYLGRVKKGDKIMVSLPSLKVNLESTIDRIGQFINAANRTFKIKTSIKNTNNTLKPNMVALLEIEDFSKDSVVVISSELLMQGAGGIQFVYVIEDVNGLSIAKKTMLEVGMTYENSAFISAGLSGGQKVVDKGARSIRNGEQVDVRN